MALIELKNIGKRFGDFTALDAVNLSITDQEFMVLLGASGCGKTTLLRIIAGLETPSTGEVWIGGRRVDQLPPRDRGIAMVFQNYAIFPHLTVFENIAFGLRMKRTAQKDITDRVMRAAELMHISPLLKRYSGQLSGGQRQRVAVARALVMEPDVILMDEPLSNLDALLRLEMRAELKGVLSESKTTAIYVTHDQVEAMSLADRISVMYGGKILQAAEPLEIYRNPAARFVGSFIGNPPMNFLPASQQAGEWEVLGLLLSGPQSGPASLEYAIRPEDLLLGDIGWPALVKVVEPLGSHLLVTCDVLGIQLRAVLDSEATVRTGDQIHLNPQPGRARWFDPETSLALPV
ncbi:MAG: ABC transporter ATP-binding protein [Deltaproteobacteria bacterium]